MAPSDAGGTVGGSSTIPIPGSDSRPAPRPAPGPSTPTPPTPSTGGAPGLATPSTGTPTTGAPVGPSTSPAPFSPAPNPAFTGSADRPVLDLEGWQLWWDVQRRGYLLIKDHLGKAHVSTGTSDYFLGQGQVEQVADWTRPTPAQIQGLIVPALLTALKDNQAPDLRAGCIIALGRLGKLLEGETQAQVTAAVLGELQADHGQVRETAALALGMLAHDEALRLLGELLEDSSLGRGLVDRGAVAPRTRAFAALGIALGGRNGDSSLRLRSGRQLSEALPELLKEANTDAAACTVMAMGLCPQPFAPAALDSTVQMPGLSLQITQLLDLLYERTTRRLVAAHIPQALVRMVESLPEHPSAVRETARVHAALIEIASEQGAARQMSDAVRDGALLALGEIAGELNAEQQAETAKAFERIRRTSTGMGPAYSLLGQGRLAAEAPDELREELEDKLMRELAHAPNRRGAWASLALGLMVHEDPEAPLPGGDLRALWSSKLERARSPEFASALGVSVGLAGLSQEEPRLLRQFEGLSEDLARGYLAESLGLAGARSSREHLSQALAESVNRPLLLGRVALALGLLEDGSVLTRLLEALEETQSSHAQGYLAAAVGIVGDVRAIEPLAEILADQSRDARLRAFAAAALGRVADPDRLPWNAVLARGLNYRFAPSAIFDGSGRGALELL